MPDLVLNGEAIDLLRQLADANGVATEFWDWSGTQRFAPASTLLEVLDVLGVPVTKDSGPDAIRAALVWTEDRPWKRVLPATTVVALGVARELPVHVPHGAVVRVWVELEDGTRRDLEQLDRYVDPREVDGVLVGRATFLLPDDLPLGYHHVAALVDENEYSQAYLYVVPQRLDPAVLAADKRYWGVNVQAYAVRSHESWGIGDALDLLDLTALCACEGADFVLVNPLHAAEPIAPIEDSPYLPVSRRWLNLLYIRPEAVVEYSQLGLRARSRIEKLRNDSMEARPNRGGGINRDAVWQAKAQALEIIFKLARPRHREAQLAAFVERGGADLESYALWCALVEHYGTTVLPEEVSNPETQTAKRLRKELTERVEFYEWAQWIAAEQLRRPNEIAMEIGMPIGIMADLAVGVAPSGPEIWGNAADFASEMSVGAPPDMYSQNGQDWSQPPWNPRLLEQSGFEPFRKVLASTMSLSGALRIDHILGLFRQWWIPRGQDSSKGTYVYFDHQAMVGILLLEAHRQGVLVIGEDLGTVEPWVRHYLAERGILGTSVLWFEKEEGNAPLAADRYREGVLATVNTHDLPPTAGYMEGIHTTLRHEAGMLVDSVEAVRAVDQAEQEAMRTRLLEVGLIDVDSTEIDVLEGLHRYIANTPSRLVAAALVDAVGQKDPQNLPGTHHEYPNWRVLLSDGNGEALWLDELDSRPDFRRFFAIMREEMNTSVRLSHPNWG